MNDLKDIDLRTPVYQIPTGLSQMSVDALLEEAKEWETRSHLAQVIDRDTSVYDLSHRHCKVSWINIDHWVAGMMAHFIHCANKNFFNINLTNWADPIQYTLYDQPGDSFGWHTDTNRSSTYPNEIRKLSIILILSKPEDYEGGEVQFHRLNELQTYKPEQGTALIFTSQLPHRVRPVKSGVRKSLVGWFGGPFWK